MMRNECRFDWQALSLRWDVFFLETPQRVNFLSPSRSLTSSKYLGSIIVPVHT